MNKRKVTRAKAVELTDDERQALEAVRHGADVYGYGIARTLRALERDKPGLVDITRAMDPPKDGAAQQPYFGAILTSKGMDALRKATLGALALVLLAGGA